MNVSLAENGGSVVATYGGAMANFVNDGDNTTTTNFWSGNIADDAVTIDFGLSRTITNNHEQSRTITEISVYTNDTSFNSVSPTKYIEISADNSTWKKTAQIVGSDVSCSTFSSGSGKIRCVFSTPQSIRYYRVRVVGAAPASQQIVEMEALGS